MYNDHELLTGKSLFQRVPGSVAVLVIHPDLTIALAIRRALSRLGHQVIVRASAERIVDDLEALSPRVILLDPERPAMSVAARIARERFPEISIVGFTANPHSKNLPKSLLDAMFTESEEGIFGAQFQHWLRGAKVQSSIPPRFAPTLQ